MIVYAYKIFINAQPLANPFKRPLFVLSLLLLLSYVLSSFLGVSTGQSFWSDILRSTGVFFLIFTAIFAFIISDSLTEKDWSSIRKSIALSSGIFSLFTIIGVEGFGFTGRFLWTNFGINGFTFGNTTFAGVFLVLALILTGIEFLKTPKYSKWRAVLIGVCIVNILSPLLLNTGILLGKTSIGDVFTSPSLLLGSARASSATTFLMALFLLGRFLIRKYIPEVKRKWTFFSWNGLWIAGVFVGVGLLFTSGSFVQNAYTDQSTEARIIVWNIGLEAFKDRPAFGWGPQNFDQAFERHFDNRLYLDENLGETWFDRAHNIVVDTLVEVGLVGILVSVILIIWFLIVIKKAKEKELIQDGEWILLSIFPFAHFLQLQTGFDTVGSYALVALFLGYGLWLEKKMLGDSVSKSAFIHKGLTVMFLLVAIFGSYQLVFKEYGRQRAILTPFVTLDTAKQKEGIEKALSRPSSFETLRLLSASFIKGSLEEIASSGGTPEVIQKTIEQSHIYEDAFIKYLEMNPENYRARMNYAYLLLIQTAIGEDKIEAVSYTHLTLPTNREV